MRSVQFNLILALALICLGGVVSAQSSTSLSFEVLGGEGGQFPILADESGNAVEYDLQDGLVAYRIDPGLSYDNPLFCFQFSEESSAVALVAEDAGGQVILESIGLDSVLTYELATGSLALSQSPSVQCFFVDDDSQNFGLFGELADNQREDTVDEGSLFNDSFASFPELDIKYENLQINSRDFQTVDGAVVSPGDELEYDVVVSNTGDATADELAFQEVFPADSAMFPASLSTFGWSCTDNSVELEDSAFCPAETGSEPLRFDSADGLQLPPNGSMTFTVIRTVQSGSEGKIRLFAGAVNGPGKSARNATARATLDIVGDPVGIAFRNQPQDADIGFDIIGLDGQPIEVEVVDANDNLVKAHDTGGISLDLFDQNGDQVVELAATQEVMSGSVVFENLNTDKPEISVGSDYSLKASFVDPSAELSDFVGSDPFNILSAN